MIESMPKQSEEWSIAQQHFMDGYNTARKEMEHLGWHPASELPKLKDGEDDVDFIVICDVYGIRLPFHATYCKFTGWSHDDVKWWCYPPKED